MQYYDGSEVHLNDRVLIKDLVAIVESIVDDARIPQYAWFFEEMGAGVLFRLSNGAGWYFDEAELKNAEDVTLAKRGK